jgi:glycosyltransferase involved in cell wall biosynthesis
MIHKQSCDVVHFTSAQTLQAAGNRIDIVYDSRLAPRGSGPGRGRACRTLGPVFDEEKTSFWKGIDIFVIPTVHREGLPYTILEALASGTPTLTTRVGGIPDVIQDGVQGVLLDDHDPGSVARTIEAMLLDRQRLREMSVAAMQRARDYYSVERLASQFDRIYRELLT